MSVICAAYNGTAFLPQTLAALQAQSMRDFEAIIVDDASTDGTPDMLAAISDPRFKILRNAQNLRLIGTRNRGVDAALAPYIAITDQDDVSHRDRLARQADYLDAHPDASAVYSLTRAVDGSGRPTGTQIDWGYDRERARAGLIFHNFVTHSTLMFRRRAVDGQVYAPDYPLCEDYSLLARLADVGSGLHLIRSRLVDYRSHETNYTHAVFGEMTRHSRRLRVDLLKRIGIAATDSELRVHDLFECGGVEPTMALHQQCRDWLLHLRDANRRAGYVHAADFDAVVAEKWLELSNQFSPLGRSAWATYSTGPVLPLSPRQVISLANFFRKTTLRRSPRISPA